MSLLHDFRKICPPQVWLLIWLAAFGMLCIIGTTGWLLFLWIAQHVRIV